MNFFKRLIGSILIAMLIPGIAMADWSFPRYWENVEGTDYILTTQDDTGTRYDIGDSTHTVPNVHMENAYIYGLLYVGGLAGSDIDFMGYNALNVGALTGSGTVLHIGTGSIASSYSLSSQSDLLVEGDLEVDGVTYMDSGFTAVGTGTITDDVVFGSDITVTGTGTFATITDSVLSITGGAITALSSITDGVASWASNSLSGFVNITATGTGTFASGNFGDGNIFNVGDIAVDSVSPDNTNISITIDSGELGIGDGTYSWTHSPNVGIEGNLEVDGIIYADGNVIVSSASTFEMSNAGAMRYGADDGWRFTVNANANVGNQNFIFTAYPNKEKDHDHDELSTNPTVWVHSATDPDTDNLQYLNFYHDTANPRFNSGKGYFTFGNNSTSRSLTGTGDVVVSGSLEVDGWVYADSRFVVNKAGNGTFFFGQINGSDYWKMGATADDGVFLAVNSTNGQGNNNFVLMSSSNTGDDYGHSPGSANPTFWIHSETPAATATDEWLSISFDPSIPGGVVATGTGTVRIDSTLSFEASSDTAQANDSTITCANGIMRIVGDGGATVLDTDPAIADGATDGQTCIIEGTSEVNTVQVDDGNNIELNGGVAFIFGQGDTLWIYWDEGDSTWYEMSRSDN